MPVVALPAPRRELLDLAREVGSALRRHRLGTHSSAVAFRVLVSMPPLALLGIGLLGAFDLESVWLDSVSPALHQHLSTAVAHACDDTAQRIFQRNGAGLLVLATALVVWNTLRAIREVEHALDEIHEQEGRRSTLSAFLVGLPLAVMVDVCAVAALLAVVVPPRVAGDGWDHDALEIARWPIAVAILWAAVTLLLRYAPGERPDLGWASAGSAFVVLGWLTTSVLFGFWSADVANYKTAVGTLTALLVLTGYVLALAFLLVLGAQLDETLRRRRKGNGRRR
jgi:membrane protein